MARMLRTQIYLEPELNEDLERLARQRGMSKAGLLRLAARRFLAEEQAEGEDPILGIIGLGNSGLTDVSERHDYYLAEEVIASRTLP